MNELGDAFFRHEHGKLVAVLARRFGVRHLERVEDAVQAALLAALESWPRTSLPDDPSAWLHRVAFRRVLDGLRRHARRGAIDVPAEETLGTAANDDLLNMLFLACDDALPVEAQLTFALKVVCGFDVREIAERLFTSEANVYKRIGRARARLRTSTSEEDVGNVADLAARRRSVQTVLYTLFTEGHLSVSAEPAIRAELCAEAVRLTEMLAADPIGATPETFALAALMHLHAARIPARHAADGGLLLLEEQERSKWNVEEIHAGLAWLERSATGDAFSRYHAEAGIAAEHCLAPSFAETRWDRIAEQYELLERIAPSPLFTLNRAVAIAEARGPEAALVLLENLQPPTWLAGSYMWSAVLADLHGRAHHDERSRAYRTIALGTAPTKAVRDLLARRLALG